MRILRMFFGFDLLLAAIAGVAYYVAGRADGPVIAINQPSIVGQAAGLDVTVDAPGGELDALAIHLEQGGQ